MQTLIKATIVIVDANNRTIETLGRIEYANTSMAIAQADYAP
jgi:hypothetical protein